GLTQDVVAADARSAGGRYQEPRDHAHGGGFAGAVGAKQAQHLARFHAYAQCVHGSQVAVAPRQLVGFDHARRTASGQGWGVPARHSSALLNIRAGAGGDQDQPVAAAARSEARENRVDPRQMRGPTSADHFFAPPFLPLAFLPLTFLPFAFPATEAASAGAAVLAGAGSGTRPASCSGV